MAADKNFRMTGTTKAMLGTMKGSKEDRGVFRAIMVGAQLAEEAAKRASLKSKDNKDGGRTRGAVAPE